MDIHQNLIIAITVISLFTLLSQWLAWYIKLPAILFLLLSGVFLGPQLGLGLVDPDALFGALLFPVVSLSVAIILFEGSLYLRFKELQGLGNTVLRLVTLGFIITLLLSVLLGHLLFHLSWPLAALLASITSIGGPTVVAPMLRTVRPKKDVHQILHWESILIDPIGAITAVLIFSMLLSSLGKSSMALSIVHFLHVILIGISVGLAAGWSLATLLKKHALPEYLQNVGTLSLVIATFTLANQLSDGAGLLAVTLMGLYLANVPDLHMQDIIHFKENLSILLISGLFILLAARIPFAHWEDYLLYSLIFYAVVQCVVRPLSIWATTYRSHLSWQEKVMLAWVCPRGIVAAAMAAIFALKLNQLGYPEANPFVLLTFMLIAFTVLIQSATARPLARWLKVAEDDAEGFLIAGANPVARAIAQALQQNGVPVLLVDTHWDNICQSRMDGLPCHYGYALAEETKQHLNLAPYHALLALTPHHEFNQLTNLHFQADFCRNRVYLLPSSAQSRTQHAKAHTAGRPPRDRLFEPASSYSKLASLLRQGATLSTTTLTPQFSFQAYRAQEKDAILLCYTDNKGRTRPFTEAEPLPEALHTQAQILALKPARQKEEGVKA